MEHGGRRQEGCSILVPSGAYVLLAQSTSEGGTEDGDRNEGTHASTDEMSRRGGERGRKRKKGARLRATAAGGGAVAAGKD